MPYNSHERWLPRLIEDQVEPTKPMRIKPALAERLRLEHTPPAVQRLSTGDMRPREFRPDAYGIGKQDVEQNVMGWETNRAREAGEEPRPYSKELKIEYVRDQLFQMLIEQPPSLWRLFRLDPSMQQRLSSYYMGLKEKALTAASETITHAVQGALVDCSSREIAALGSMLAKHGGPKENDFPPVENWQLEKLRSLQEKKEPVVLDGITILDRDRVLVKNQIGVPDGVHTLKSLKDSMSPMTLDQLQAVGRLHRPRVSPPVEARNGQLVRNKNGVSFMMLKARNPDAESALAMDMSDMRIRVVLVDEVDDPNVIDMTSAQDENNQ